MAPRAAGRDVRLLADEGLVGILALFTRERHWTCFTTERHWTLFTTELTELTENY